MLRGPKGGAKLLLYMSGKAESSKKKKDSDTCLAMAFYKLQLRSLLWEAVALLVNGAYVLTGAKWRVANSKTAGKR